MNGPFRISHGTIEVDGWQLTVWVNELVLVIGTGGRGVLTILLDGVDFDMEMEFFMVAKRSTMWLKTRIVYILWIWKLLHISSAQKRLNKFEIFEFNLKFENDISDKTKVL